MDDQHHNFFAATAGAVRRLLPALGVLLVLMSSTAPAQSTSEASAVHQEVFARLAHDYCFEFAGRKEDLIERLVSNHFQTHPDHALTFVREFAGVSYAITVDERRCTADVLLSSLAAEGVPTLFEAKDIVAKLSQRMNAGVVGSETRTDLDSMGSPTRVLWVQFDDPGRYISLSYPQERTDTYFLVFDAYRLAN